MTTLSVADQDMLYSLSWYMSARQTALRSALVFRAQLSANDQTDMRVHYSGYFLNLLAATDLFLETTTLQPKEFEARLCARLAFDGFQDGESNYCYIRELRNAVVHRGLDITSAVHYDGNFPMIIAAPRIENRSGTKTFATFGKYLLQVIAKCESVVGPVMLDFLNAAGVFERAIDAEGAVAEYRKAVEQSHAMPDHVKATALVMEFRPEWALAAHSAAMTKLRAALAPCDASRPRAI